MVRKESELVLNIFACIPDNIHYVGTQSKVQLKNTPNVARGYAVLPEYLQKNTKAYQSMYSQSTWYLQQAPISPSISITFLWWCAQFISNLIPPYFLCKLLSCSNDDLCQSLKKWTCTRKNSVIPLCQWVPCPWLRWLFCCNKYMAPVHWSGWRHPARNFYAS